MFSLHYDPKFHLETFSAGCMFSFSRAIRFEGPEVSNPLTRVDKYGLNMLNSSEKVLSAAYMSACLSIPLSADERERERERQRDEGKPFACL